MHRRTVLSLGTGALASVVASQPARAQANTLKIVFPFAAGGPGDAMSRMVADSIGASLGRNAIVENRTGADGRLGITHVKNSAADGNTLLATTGPTMWLMHLVHKTPGFDPYVDFAPITRLARFDFAIAVANNVKVSSLTEFVSWAIENPAKASYAIPGAGTIPHFTGVQLSKLIGVDMVRVVYRGSVPSVNDVISGHIPIAIVPLGDCLQHYRAGTLKIVAVTSEKRSPFAPEVPTLRENGINLVGDAWYGLWAPAGTPKDLIDKINKATVDLLGKDDIKDRLSKLGLIAAPSTPSELDGMMRAAAAAWGPVIKETGYTIDQ